LASAILEVIYVGDGGMIKAAFDEYERLNSQAVLASLSEDLALPLIQIRSSLELLKSQPESSAEQIDLSVENGLQLIEAYKLALTTSQNFDSLILEPLAVGRVLESVAEELTPYAQKYNTSLEVVVSGRLRPVLTHLPSLKTTIRILGASMIRTQAAQSKQRKYRLILGAHRQTDSIVSAGVFSNVQGISDKTLKTARHISGRAKQPLPAMPPGAVAGILIADMLCANLWQPLRSAAYAGLNGLATNIPISKQLQIV
jgi:hypothetical protein